MGFYSNGRFQTQCLSNTCQKLVNVECLRMFVGFSHCSTWRYCCLQSHVCMSTVMLTVGKKGCGSWLASSGVHFIAALPRKIVWLKIYGRYNTHRQHSDLMDPLSSLIKKIGLNLINNVFQYRRSPVETNTVNC